MNAPDIPLGLHTRADGTPLYHTPTLEYRAAIGEAAEIYPQLVARRDRLRRLADTAVDVADQCALYDLARRYERAADLFEGYDTLLDGLPDVAPAPAEASPARPCRLCGASIVFVRTARGRTMPVEAAYRQGDGRVALLDDEGVVHAHAGKHVRGREPHFGNCEPYQKGRRDKRQASGAEVKHG
jgi:hypothetical protein